MIINTQRDVVLAKSVKLANNPFTRMKGLMGVKRLESQEALFIYPCQQIHTFFMRFPIDCLFIDRHYVVIKALRNIQPWKISEKVPKAWGVIELPKGVIEHTNTQRSEERRVGKEERERKEQK